MKTTMKNARMIILAIVVAVIAAFAGIASSAKTMTTPVSTTNRSASAIFSDVVAEPDVDAGIGMYYNTGVEKPNNRTAISAAYCEYDLPHPGAKVSDSDSMAISATYSTTGNTGSKNTGIPVSEEFRNAPKTPRICCVD